MPPPAHLHGIYSRTYTKEDHYDYINPKITWNYHRRSKVVVRNHQQNIPCSPKPYTHYKMFQGNSWVYFRKCPCSFAMFLPSDVISYSPLAHHCGALGTAMCMEKSEQLGTLQSTRCWARNLCRAERHCTSISTTALVLERYHFHQELCAMTPFPLEDLLALLNLVSHTHYLDMDKTSIIHKTLHDPTGTGVMHPRVRDAFGMMWAHLAHIHLGSVFSGLLRKRPRTSLPLWRLQRRSHGHQVRS